MGNVLRIDSSSRTQGSQSRLLGDHFEKLWLSRHNHDVITRRDLVFQPIPPITSETILGSYTPADQLTPELQAATALSDELIKELMAANTVLLTIPMYNFTVPSAFKAWVDQIVRLDTRFLTMARASLASSLESRLTSSALTAPVDILVARSLALIFCNRT